MKRIALLSTLVISMFAAGILLLLPGCSDGMQDYRSENLAKPIVSPTDAEAVSVYSNEFGQFIETVNRINLRSWLSNHKDYHIDSLVGIAEGGECNPTDSFLIIYSKPRNGK